MFNIKCNVISITNATKKIHHQYSMHNEPLNSIDSCVYLRVTVNSRLRWNQHIDRRLHSRLTIMYKITNKLVEVSQKYHPVPRPQNSARGHPRQFQRFQPTVDAFKYAFLPRTIPAWNALPQAVAEAGSLDIFKWHMSRHLQFWPSASCTIVCTCPTAHSFPVLIYAPAFAVADHRGHDPASSVLSFEGRCYLLIQIQIQMSFDMMSTAHHHDKSLKNDVMKLHILWWRFVLNLRTIR